MSSIPPTTTNTWKQFILDDPGAHDASSSTELFLAGTRQNTPNNNKMEELRQNPRTPIMALAPVTGKIKIYYAFKNLGGT